MTNDYVRKGFYWPQRIWKILATNYYVKNDFREVGGFNRSHNWFVEYFPIGGSRHLVLRRSDSNVTITTSIILDQSTGLFDSKPHDCLCRSAN